MLMLMLMFMLLPLHFLSQSRSNRKSSNTLCFRIFFCKSRDKQYCKYYFFAPWKPKTTVFAMIFGSGDKNHGVYIVFSTAPDKNTGMYAVFGTLQKVIFLCKKSPKPSVLGLLLGFVTRWKGGVG